MTTDYGIEVLLADGREVLRADGTVGRQVITSDNLEIRQLLNSVLAEFAGDHSGEQTPSLPVSPWNGSSVPTDKKIAGVIQIELVAGSFVDIQIRTRASTVDGIRIYMLSLLLGVSEEHILLDVDPKDSYDKGTTTSAGTTLLLNDSNQNWPPGVWAASPSYCWIRPGTTTAETRLIKDNTATQLTMDAEFVDPVGNGEPYWIMPIGAEDGGEATSGTNTTLIDTSKSWPGTALGLTVVLRPGLATEEVRAIDFIASTTIQVFTAWDANPVAGDEYVVTDGSWKPGDDTEVDLIFNPGSFPLDHFRESQARIVLRPGDSTEQTITVNSDWKGDPVGHPADIASKIFVWNDLILWQPGNTVGFLDRTYVQRWWPSNAAGFSFEQAAGGALWGQFLAPTVSGLYEIAIGLEYPAGAAVVNLGESGLQVFEYLNSA